MWELYVCTRLNIWHMDESNCMRYIYVCVCVSKWIPNHDKIQKCVSHNPLKCCMLWVTYTVYPCHSDGMFYLLCYVSKKCVSTHPTWGVVLARQRTDWLHYKGEALCTTWLLASIIVVSPILTLEVSWYFIWSAILNGAIGPTWYLTEVIHIVKNVTLFMTVTLIDFYSALLLLMVKHLVVFKLFLLINWKYVHQLLITQVRFHLVYSFIQDWNFNK